MTSLKLFSFRNVENRLFSFSSMLDNDYWAAEIIWRNLETDLKYFKAISKHSRSEAEKCISVMAEASGVSFFLLF